MIQISSDLRCELKQNRDIEIVGSEIFMDSPEFSPEKEDFELKPQNIQSAPNTAGKKIPKKFPKYENFEEIYQMVPEREEPIEIHGYPKPIIPSKNTERETVSQKLTSEKLRSAVMRKTKPSKPIVRNYNLKDS